MLCEFVYSQIINVTFGLCEDRANVIKPFFTTISPKNAFFDTKDVLFGTHLCSLRFSVSNFFLTKCYYHLKIFVSFIF